MACSSSDQVGQVLHPASKIVTWNPWYIPGSFIVITTRDNHCVSVRYWACMPRYCWTLEFYIEKMHIKTYSVSYLRSKESSVVPSVLAISDVFLEPQPPSRMIPSATCQLECAALVCLKVWLLLQPDGVNFRHVTYGLSEACLLLLLASSVYWPPQTVLLFILWPYLGWGRSRTEQDTLPLGEITSTSTFVPVLPKPPDIIIAGKPAIQINELKWMNVRRSILTITFWYWYLWRCCYIFISNAAQSWRIV